MGEETVCPRGNRHTQIGTYALCHFPGPSRENTLVWSALKRSGNCLNKKKKNSREMHRADHLTMDVTSETIPGMFPGFGYVNSHIVSGTHCSRHTHFSRDKICSRESKYVHAKHVGMKWAWEMSTQALDEIHTELMQHVPTTRDGETSIDENLCRRFTHTLSSRWYGVRIP